MDIMHNIKGTNIVALAIPKLCTVIDTPRARYDMLQRESFVLQQYPEKSQWTDAEEILLDDGCWLTFASWNNMEHIFLSRHGQNKYASEAGFCRGRDGFTNRHRVTRYGGTLGFCPTSSWPGAVPASTSGRIPARFPGSLLGWNWIQGLKILPFLDVIT